MYSADPDDRRVAHAFVREAPEDDEDELCPEELDEESTFLSCGRRESGRAASAAKTTSKVKREYFRLNIIMKSSASLPLLLSLRALGRTPILPKT